MKKVFKVETEEITKKEEKFKDTYFIFSGSMKQAIRKVCGVMDEKMHIVRAELHCVVEEDKDLTAKQVAELIGKCTSEDELKVYESDKRQVAKAAYNKKIKEING